jgi:hypothetical protein
MSFLATCLTDLQKSGDFFVGNFVKFWRKFFNKSLILQRKILNFAPMKLAAQYLVKK